jgi:hypothetical protein
VSALGKFSERKRLEFEGGNSEGSIAESSAFDELCLEIEPFGSAVGDARGEALPIVTGSHSRSYNDSPTPRRLRRRKPSKSKYRRARFA